MRNVDDLVCVSDEVTSVSCLSTEVDGWWSWKGKEFSWRYNCSLQRKVENFRPCRQPWRSSFECTRKEDNADLQWETSSFASPTWILLSKFLCLFVMASFNRPTTNAENEQCLKYIMVLIFPLTHMNAPLLNLQWMLSVVFLMIKWSYQAFNPQNDH